VPETVSTAELSGQSAVQERLEWLMLFRLVLVTLLLGSAIAVNLNDAKSFSDPSHVGMVSLIVGTYVATLGYVAWLRSSWSLSRLAHLQIAGDTLLVSGLVFLTSGLDSIFIFLFFLTIFSGAVLSGRGGALFAASLGAVGLVLNIVVQFSAGPGLQQLFPELAQVPARVPVYALLIHIVALYTVAFLSGFLAEKLGQVGSELERRQLDLRELRALNDDIVRSVDSGLLTLDVEDRIIFANESAERITGLPLRQLSFQRLADRLPRLMGAIERLKLRGERYREDLSLPHPDGSTRHLAISMSPLRNAKGNPSGSILLLEDLTTLRALKDQLARQQQLASLGDLAAGIAHEIRNPLAAISGSVEMLRANAAGNPEDQALMEIVLREVDRLNGLITEFLDYARPRSIHLRRADLIVLLQETVQMFRQDHEMAANVSFELQTGSWDGVWLEIDPDRMRQVLWNLLRNACQAQQLQGAVKIRLEPAHDSDDIEWIQVLIDDEGPGLAMQALEKLFEPFFTTKPDGTGLGLATSHRIVSEHGGQLLAENLPTGGARFTVRLPFRTRPGIELPATDSGDFSVQQRRSFVTPKGAP